MTRVLLTGASGFVGSHCIAALMARGYEVHAVSTSARQSPDVTWHQADLLDAAQVTALMQRVRPTHLLHLAWVVTPGAYWTSPLNWRWLDASLTLLEAFGAHGGERVVMAGTCAEYDWAASAYSERATPLAPATVYGACKAALGIMLPAFAERSSIRSTAWARLFYLYGPGEHPSRLVPSAIRALGRGEPMPCSHGEQIRDFLYIGDAAAALVSLLGSEVTGPVNVASGEPTMLRAMLSMIGGQMGQPELLQFGARPAGANEPPILVADVERLAHEVGWTPTTGLDEGLRRTIAWWQREATA